MIKIKEYFLSKKDKHYIGYLKNYNHYQEAQRNRALAQVQNWRVAIDIGANIGLWSKDLSSYFSKTICFEPNKDCIKYLKKNININKSKIYNVALGSKECKLDLHTPLESGGSSFINKTKVGVDKDGTTIYGPFDNKIPKINVLVKTLDSYNFKNIDFIKIDVQGFELEVLKGSLITLQENNPVICVEENEINLNNSN
ncbi:FkbM family methyltransferase, partial [Pelagibacteraceae bacterium]|nr:FkbM family methyltransferase [Pelagibacteraceae bacterium]